ncbi:MAG: flagellar biosynthesis protein FlhA [bacterium]|nr:flagellar biosynthesis protein FlhA [bacterium]
MAESLLVRLRDYGHLAAPMAILGTVFLILVPLPAGILDVFFTFNIILSITILLMSTYISDPVEFSVYPSVLLMASLYRMGLNISSTRLILAHGDEGKMAAGKVIGAFGQFVIGDSYIIGIVVFVVIIAIQKLVVAAGAGRATEVAARFTLDKMPGKQMSIDADLNNGLITQEEAVERRSRIEREAEFFGTMDGAIKFTTKEATVSIIITMVNIIGGILVGVLQKGMDFAGAMETYAVLTVGDGLMAAVPSLLITVSGGLIATRAVSDKTLGEDMTEQALFNPNPLKLAGMTLSALAIVPGLPLVPFLMLGGLFGYLSHLVKKEQTVEVVKKEEEELQKKELPPPPEKIESLLKVDLLGLEIGYSLIQLVDTGQGGTLLQRIKSMRKQLAMDLGIIVPPVRIRDNLQLGSREYAILLKGVQIIKGEVMTTGFMAINPGNVKEKLKGKETLEPAFGLKAYWITEEEREHAQFLGYTIVDPATVITTHLTEVIKTHSFELLGRQETQHLVDNLASSYPKVVEELIPNLMGLGHVQKVLQNLLKEKVSVFDLRTILETLADYAPAVKDLTTLTELVRQALSRSLVKPYITAGNDLPVLVLGGELENALISKVQRINEMEQLVIQPDEAQLVINKFKATIEKAGLKVQPILLCSSLIRHHLRQLTERFLPDLVLLSATEIPRNVKIISLGVVE